MNISDIKNRLSKLNTRSTVIIAALALPIILLALVMHSAQPKPHPMRLPLRAIHARFAPRPRPHPTLEQVRNRTKARLEQLQKMTPAQWVQERRIHPWANPTLAGAIKWNTNRLAQLNAMTPQQWEAHFRPRPPMAPAQRRPAPGMVHPAAAHPAPSASHQPSAQQSASQSK